MNQTVLMACTHPYWSALQVGSQHLARQFALKGWQVYYFSAPITPLHLIKLSSPEIKQRFQSSIHTPSIYQNGKIRAFTPFSLIAPDSRPILRDFLITLNWHKTMIPSIKKFLDKHELAKVSLLYIDNLSYHFLLDFVAYDRGLFRVMDIHEHFPGWQGKARKLAHKISQLADVTAYSAQSLKSYVDSLSPPKTAFVPNGVDFDFFNFPKTSGHRHPLVDSIPKPIVLYTGMIDFRLDFNLIRFAAKKLSQVSFVFIGPVAFNQSLLDFPDNVYFLGQVAHAELPYLMQEAIAGIIPFDIQNRMNHIQGIRPLKLLEYLASGLPVICARWPEVETMGSPAWFYDHEQEFVKLVEKVIIQEPDPGPYKAFAAKHDWRNVYQSLISSLS